MRKTSFFLALGLAFVTVAAPLYAAVENVKVSGDITARAIIKDHYSLGGASHTDTFNGTIFNAVDPTQKFYMSQTRIRVDADVSNHVSGQVEFLNQRDWDAPTGGAQGSGLTNGTNVGPGGGPSANNDQFDVIMNLANITIKELYYPELSVRIGRQNIQWGEGFVIGQQQLSNPDPSNTISADEFSLFNSLDAIRAMINKDPWHFDLVLAKVKENIIDQGDDRDLYGINIGRSFSQYQAEGEVYFLMDKNANRVDSVGDVFERTEKLYNLGTRGSLHPWDRLKLSGETVFQWGDEGGAGTAALNQFTLNGQRRQKIVAWAFDLRGEWQWLELPWPATIGAEWVFYSGEENSEGDKSNNYRPLWRGKFHSAIREFQGQFYQTDLGVTPGFTNESQLIFDAGFHPFNNKDLTFFSRWLVFWLDEESLIGRGKYLGNEIDLTLTYDYTQDLKFKLINAFFMPSDSYFGVDATGSNAAGQQISSATNAAKLFSGEVVLSF